MKSGVVMPHVRLRDFRLTIVGTWAPFREITSRSSVVRDDKAIFGRSGRHLSQDNG